MQTAKQQARHKNCSFSTTTAFTHKSMIPTSLKSMDLTRPKQFKPPSVCDAHVGVKEPPFEGKASLYETCEKSKGNPFADDPLCKLNLKETCEFVRSFPVADNSIQGKGILDISAQRRGVNSVVQQRRPEAEAPSTPGRPLFRFSVANHSRKSCPSKWDDAEKWLITSSCHDSPANALRPSPDPSKQCAFAGKEKLTFRDGTTRSFNDVPPTDKFTDDVDPILPNFRYSEPSKDGFLFRNPAGSESMKNAITEVVHHKDVGTEMTTSRCHRPFKSSSSPARHNTPTNRSGFLAMVNSDSTMEVCHLAKLQLGTQYDSVASHWSSKEEEEQSLRHFDTSNGFRTRVSESTAASLEEEEKTRCCLRYQREEAKIQAWANLQNAKAEAQARKLEVRIQKMRSEQEEKLIKRMEAVQRKAEEWKISAQEQHSEQVQRAGEQIQKMINSQPWGHRSCGCFPCNKP